MKVPQEKSKRILVAFYSGTGRTQAPMLRVMEALDGERLITIRPKTPRTGLRVIKAGWEALRKKPAKLEPLSEPVNMAAYDLVVLGSPVWASRVSSPMRAFLAQYGAGIKQAAFVLTHAGPEDYTETFAELAALAGVKPCATLSLDHDEAKNKEKLAVFLKTLTETLGA